MTAAISSSPARQAGCRGSGRERLDGGRRRVGEHGQQSPPNGDAGNSPEKPLEQAGRNPPSAI